MSGAYLDLGLRHASFASIGRIFYLFGIGTSASTLRSTHNLSILSTDFTGGIAHADHRHQNESTRVTKSGYCSTGTD